MNRVVWTNKEREQLALEIIKRMAVAMRTDPLSLDSASIISYRGFFTHVLPEAQKTLSPERRRSITQYQMVPWLQSQLDETLLVLQQSADEEEAEDRLVRDTDLDALFACAVTKAAILEKVSEEFTLVPRSGVPEAFKSSRKEKPTEAKVRKKRILIYGLIGSQQQRVHQQYGGLFDLRFLRTKEVRRIGAMGYCNAAIAVTTKVSHAADVLLSATFGSQYIRVHMTEGVMFALAAMQQNLYMPGEL